MDLVMISATSDPPVCKIVDYGKLRYQLERKKKETAKKTTNKEVLSLVVVDLNNALSTRFSSLSLSRCKAQGTQAQLQHW